MSAPSIARLTDPGEIVAVVPQLCGFLPEDSLVVLSLRGQRRRVGLTVRLDLPRVGDEAAVAALCAARIVGDGAAAAVACVFGAEPREGLVAEVRAACEDAGVPLVEALHVDGGRWTSYACDGPCCPAGGTPVPVRAAVLDLVAAERTAAGRAVLRSREELVASVAPPEPSAKGAAQVEAARQQAHRTGAGELRGRTVALADALLDAVSEGGAVDGQDAAQLAVGLEDVLARDEVATRMLDRSAALLAVLVQVVRLVGAPVDAPTCALLAWVAYGSGDGALANIALDRALAAQPEHSLGLLLRACLDAGLPPDELRDVARATRDALRRPG